MENPFKGYFYFSRTERRGTLVLSMIIIILVWLPYILDYLVPQEKYDLDYFIWQSKAAIVGPDSLAMDTLPYKGNYSGYSRKYQGNPSWNKKAERPLPAILELNAADSAALEGLPCIGPALATRILKYRNRLGGFVGKEQLKEIWGLPPDCLERLLSLVEADSSLVKKIDINTVEFNQLLKHPYAGYRIARDLLAFRKKYGSIADPSDLLKSGVIPDTSWIRLRPYLGAATGN